MASPFQQQARQRKFVYGGLILVLFAAAFLWRAHFAEAKADELGVRELNRGEVELTGSLVRLTLTGSRGLATCVLWVNAIEKQKKNQWNELEVVVRSLTKLQPHFITPWQFQSWNLAYNVSVESDRVADKYFYVTRGIQLLAEGERQNRDHPDLRFFLGFYPQNKVHLSDETNVMRSLFQLSMIPPNERDPERFRVTGPDGRVGINYAELEDFCRKHPQLVRRLREGIRRDNRRELRRQFTCERPEDLVQFLADNYRVPCVYQDVPPAAPGAWKRDPEPRLKELTERFPVLPPSPAKRVRPPQRPFDPTGTELTDESPLDDSHDCHAVARAWYGAAQEPIPDPDVMPGSNKPVEDRTRQRRPKQMTTVIFRQYPARSQSYIGERLQQENWFDEEGYEVPGWFQRRDDVPAGQTRPVVVGGGVKWSADAWERAAQLWREHGQRNHLLFRSEAEEQNFRDQAAAFEKKYNLTPGARPPELREEALDPETREQYFAARYLWEYNFYRGIGNFPHHYTKALVEAKDETVTARKLFAKAERLRLTGSPEQALDLYLQPEALQAWRDQVLLKNKDYRRDRLTQEETCEVQLSFLDLFYEQYGRQVRQQLARRLLPLSLAGQAASAAAGPALAPTWFPLAALTRTNPFAELEEVVYGPFDVVDEEGVPLVQHDVLQQVEDRRAQFRGASAAKKEVRPRPMLTLDGKPASLPPPPPSPAPPAGPPARPGG